MIHGTSYNNWANIQRSGISKGNRPFIPCFLDNSGNKSGHQSFQLHIYINKESATKDGIAFTVSYNGKVKCSGNKDGVLEPKHFLRVVDMHSGQVIFRPYNYGNDMGLLPNLSEPPPGMHGVLPINEGNNSNRTQNKGRGSIPFVKPPETANLFQNIWSQVKRIDSDSVDLRPCTNLSKLTPQNPSVESRTELSIETLFSGASNSTLPKPDIIGAESSASKKFDIMGLLNEASEKAKLGKATNVNTTTDTLQESNATKNSATNSSFIPTQVIRKQTPIKSQPANQKQNEQSPPKIIEVQEKVVSEQKATNKGSNTSQSSVKKKKQRQSRIAANFSQK